MVSIQFERALRAAALGFCAALLLAAAAEAQNRWVVPLQSDAQLPGLIRAAAARGCVDRNVDARFVSFDCPQGVSPALHAVRALRYEPHDDTTNALIRASEVHGGATPAGAFDGTGVRVAVVDSGLDTNHPALAGVLADPNADCVNTTGDMNACEDIDGHGTAVSAIIAGIFAAAGSPSPDSVAPGASIVSIKVFPDDGSDIFSDDVAVAIQRAIDLGADVVNVSLGGGASTGVDCDGAGDPAVDKINLDAAPAGVTVVVSSGNDGFNEAVSFPACASQAIAAGAVYQRNEGGLQWIGLCIDRRTQTDLVTCFSNAGPALDVVAPGAFLWTAQLGGGFGFFHGTSAAAPVVSGAVALLKAQQPGLTPAEVREALTATALELGNGRNRRRNGEGRIDALAAAEYVDQNLTPIPCSIDADCEDGDACNGTEVCVAGSCGTGSPIVCADDGDPCTDQLCSPATGLCDPVDNGQCGACTPAPKGLCNCDGKCTRKEAAGGVCADCP